MIQAHARPRRRNRKRFVLCALSMMMLSATVASQGQVPAQVPAQISVRIPQQVPVPVPVAAPATRGPPPQQRGTTIVGEQEAAVGLYLAPWKNEQPAEVSRPPGLYDPVPAPLDTAGHARAAEHYAVGRAYRAERLLRAR